MNHTLPKLLLFLLLFMPVIAICQSQFGHICGENDFIHTNSYDGRFRVPYRWVQKESLTVTRLNGCSGTLISSNLVITAAHCDPQEGDSILFNYVLGGQSTKAEIYKVMESDIVIDYAIVQISPVSFQPQQITDQIPNTGDEIYIIGHPWGRPMMISAGPLVLAGDMSVRYRADTEGGSSGSGVINHDGQLFAVHQWGSCKPGWSGFNGGTTIKSISWVSPIIREILAYEYGKYQSD